MVTKSAREGSLHTSTRVHAYSTYIDIVVEYHTISTSYLTGHGFLFKLNVEDPWIPTTVSVVPDIRKRLRRKYVDSLTDNLKA